MPNSQEHQNLLHVPSLLELPCIYLLSICLPEMLPSSGIQGGKLAGSIVCLQGIPVSEAEVQLPTAQGSIQCQFSQLVDSTHLPFSKEKFYIFICDLWKQTLYVLIHVYLYLHM